MRPWMDHEGTRLAAAALLSALGLSVRAEALTPAQEQASFRLADDRLRIELAAAEPEVLSPVAIAFDADGSLFAAEMLDYPNASTRGRIRLLRDQDADGRYETAVVFADDFPFPNGVLPWNGGLLVTAAPDIWYCRDLDGDGRADERRVMFTGFGLGNQQLRVNGLTWGLDNWVYGSNGRSEGEIRRPEDPSSQPVSIRGQDFRFRPDTGAFEAIAGRGQFGLGRDDWGNRFVSWNTIPLRHEVLAKRYLDRNRHLAATESLVEILEAGDAGRVYPLAPPPLTFNNESVRHFNALAGLAIYRGGALGPTYRGNAFVGESLLNLVHRRVLEPDGVTFVAGRGERDKEFLASADPWFHPVNFATGPDGALYVVDFYRRFVEHPDWVRGRAREETRWEEGAGHGRIWRISRLESGRAKPEVRLSRARVAELVLSLEDENGWRRDTAQRLLVERRDGAAVGPLEKLAREASTPLGQVHALHTLEGLEALRPEVLLAAMNDPHAGVREQAVRLTEPWLGRRPPGPSDTQGPGADDPAGRLRGGVLALAGDPAVRVRFQVALSLGYLEGEDKVGALTRIAKRDGADRWPALAILSSVGSEQWSFLRRLIQEEPSWLNTPNSGQAAFLEQAARLVGANPSETDLEECLAVLGNAAPASPAWGRLAILAGLADGLARTPHPLRRLLAQPPGGLAGQLPSLRELTKLAAGLAAASSESLSHRLLAIRILGLVVPEWSGQALLGLMGPDHPAEIQSAAARALAELDDALLAQTVFDHWSRQAAGTRRRLLSAAPRSLAMMAALASHLESGNVLPVELDAVTRQSLLNTPNDRLKRRFEKYFEPISNSDRAEVVRRFQPALRLDGDRRRGAEIFAKACVLCHTVEGRGQHVGPDLSGIGSRPKESLLADILDPSRQVPPDFINYTLITADGKVVTGFILSETDTSVTLRGADGVEDTVLRKQIEELRAEGKSLMPEGLEQGLEAQDMADLLSFLQKPEAQWLPAAQRP